MRPLAHWLRPGTCALVVLLAAPGAAERGAMDAARGLPPIVFVSRQPVPGETGAIPGLGPHHRAVATGGRLLVRERDGRVRELLPAGAFFDVSDPSVSRDAKAIAFAAVAHADSGWRIWTVRVDGTDLRPVTAAEGSPAGVAGSIAAQRDPLAPGWGPNSGPLPDAFRPRYDDLDPCWIDDSTLVFASTRLIQRAQYADVPVTQLYETTRSRSGWTRPVRITAERNGAEEPTMDWAGGRIVFARWWFNRHRAAHARAGISIDPAEAVARDTVNLWQPMELVLSDPRARLAAGDLRSRRGTMGYQPAPLADGSIVATYAANLGLSPRPGGTGIHVLPRRFRQARRLAGALVSARQGDVYGGTEGLAPPSACSPAGLPEGRVLFSYDPGARGDLGLYVMHRDGSGLARVLDLPGTLELDAMPIVARARPPRPAPLAGDELEGPSPAGASAGGAPRTPAGARARYRKVRGEGFGEFRYHDLDVFADGPAGSPARGAAPRTPGARIRFFAALSRPERAGGDTAILVREVPVGPGGEVNERGLPADLPMFEQLVGPDGRVLMTAHGPAHVAGLNSGVAGTTARCVGCHLGHSTLPVAAATPRNRNTRP